MDCRHLEDSYELFLLGAATEEETVEIGEHLAGGCATCLHHLREAALTLYLLSLTVHPARPNPKAKAHLLHRLRKK